MPSTFDRTRTGAGAGHLQAEEITAEENPAGGPPPPPAPPSPPTLDSSNWCLEAPPFQEGSPQLKFARDRSPTRLANARGRRCLSPGLGFRALARRAHHRDANGDFRFRPPRGVAGVGEGALFLLPEPASLRLRRLSPLAENVFLSLTRRKRSAGPAAVGQRVTSRSGVMEATHQGLEATGSSAPPREKEEGAGPSSGPERNSAGSSSIPEVPPPEPSNANAVPEGIPPPVAASFRQFRYRDAAGPREAFRQLRELSRQWLRPDIRTKEQIVEMLVQEQLLAIMPEAARARRLHRRTDVRITG
ncbi:PREDICTED: LOW QUALITY PROTEIN: SCAN domain-containing protein 1 [Myotis brandtii]|uniref:LOW QUALITY PROTEIN: SCAN domain-containing protein 1 n=1 Tax=Myotis brandtii TaxID=109478 RepID=UPI0007043806|nr:PREDICTED: LOW QUALITY PROTEIN: SCAN domain-containing protein 1 [Myotis brandtii]